MNEALNRLLQNIPGAGAIEPRADGLWMDAPDLDVVEAALVMMDQGARLSTITAIAVEAETQIIYHYCIDGTAINLSARTRGNCLPSITPVTSAANWAEREITDLYAVTFAGHPNPDRLIRPAQLQPGYFREPGGAAGKAARSARN